MTDKETADQVTHLRIKANMLRMGERIAFGSDSYALECAAETIERLIRERDEANAAAEAHEVKWRSICKAERSDGGMCACSYDKPDDVCAFHSPKLAAAEARVAELEGALAHARAWHESEAKALSKSGRSDADYHWRRGGHADQIADIRQVLPDAEYHAALDRINARAALGRGA
jgi:hypothetical protein